LKILASTLRTQLCGHGESGRRGRHQDREAGRGACGYLEMNVYEPLMIFNITHSITIMTDGCPSFRKFLVEGTKPNLKKIKTDVERSLMLVTALLADCTLRDGPRSHPRGGGLEALLRQRG
jgi:hypothetical protein